MFRILFTMVFTVLVGLGGGYVLWGSRVARLTESLSGLTLELDTMRARLAAPAPAAEAETPGTSTAGELRVINETLAAVRQDLADQKLMLEKAAADTATVGPNVAACEANLRGVRNELALCEADRKDLQTRPGAVPPPPAAYAPPPAYEPPPRPYSPPAAPADPRFN